MSLLSSVAVSAASAFAGSAASALFGGNKAQASPTSVTSISPSSLMAPVEAEDANKNFGGGGGETAKAESKAGNKLTVPGDNPMMLANLWDRFFFDSLVTKEPSVDERRKTRR